MSTVQTEVCNGTDGRLHRIATNGLSTGLFIDGQQIHTPEPALFPRAAASRTATLVAFKGHATDVAYVVGDHGRYAALGASYGNYSQAIEAEDSGLFTVVLQTTATTFETIYLDHLCQEVDRQPGTMPQTSQGLLDLIGGQPIWNDRLLWQDLSGVRLHRPMRRGDWTVGLRGDPNGVLAYHHPTQAVYLVSDEDVQLAPRLAMHGHDPVVAVSIGIGDFVARDNFVLLQGGTPVPGPTPTPPPVPAPTPVPQVPVDLSEIHGKLDLIMEQFGELLNAMSAIEETHDAQYQDIAHRLDMLEQKAHPTLSGYLNAGWLGKMRVTLDEVPE